MFVVVGGDMMRDSQQDKEAVNSLLDSLKAEYSDLTIIGFACEFGIGQFVKERCIANKGNIEFGFIEVSIRLWRRFGKEKEGRLYTAMRNPGLIEVGERFELFPSSKMKVGHLSDLIDRVKEKGLPLALHYPYNRIERSSGEDKQTLTSDNLKESLE